MADTPQGETATPEAPSNEAPAVAAPVANATDNAEVERLRKELEQKDLRNRQLENEAKARKEQEEEAQRKQLEEDNKYKELFEQEKLKRESLESDKEEKERQAALTEAKATVLSEYSSDVKALAEDVGLELADADEATVAEFKGKLDKLSQRVANGGKVTPNNPPKPGQKHEFTTEELQRGLSDEKSFHDIVTSKFPGIAAMTQKKQ